MRLWAVRSQCRAAKRSDRNRGDFTLLMKLIGSLAR
jgi:hypothetical protein